MNELDLALAMLASARQTQAAVTMSLMPMVLDFNAEDIPGLAGAFFKDGEKYSRRHIHVLRSAVDDEYHDLMTTVPSFVESRPDPQAPNYMRVYVYRVPEEWIADYEIIRNIGLTTSPSDVSDKFVDRLRAIYPPESQDTINLLFRYELEQMRQVQ